MRKKKTELGDLTYGSAGKTAVLWQPCLNVSEVNTSGQEGWPFVSEDGNELWITRRYNGSPGIFRSIRKDGGNWGEPELIISQFAGEASLDREDNIYFTHHFYKDSVMLESGYLCSL